MPIVHIILHTHDVCLYKSFKTSSCEGRVMRLEYELLEQTTCYWVGQNKYNWVRGVCKHWESEPRTRSGWTNSRGAVENSCSSMY